MLQQTLPADAAELNADLMATLVIDAEFDTLDLEYFARVGMLYSAKQKAFFTKDGCRVSPRRADIHE